VAQDDVAEPPRGERVNVIVAARDEADRLGATLAALARALPGAQLWVADDGSRDATASIARAAGARVVSSGRPAGKGETMTAASHEALAKAGPPAEATDAVFLLCDADLGESAGELARLLDVVRAGEADLAVAVFTRRQGGGFGLAQSFARWAIRARCGLQTRAPICGQRALTAAALRRVLPFAAGYGMELGMTIDAVRAGLAVCELELALEHRAVGRTPAGFAHRARQLIDFARAYRARAGPAVSGEPGTPRAE
jgi:glycosyltransferase involved in cell wall biosynthesis